MKDIKSYVIGFLSCACLFLIMGQTKADNDDYEIVLLIFSTVIIKTSTHIAFKPIPISTTKST